MYQPYRPDQPGCRVNYSPYPGFVAEDVRMASDRVVHDRVVHDRVVHERGTDDPVAAPRWLDDREARAWRGFVRLQAEVLARTGRQLQRDSGLSEPDYAVLVNLSEAPDGRLRAFALGRVLQWEKSRLSHHLTRMELRGLVKRERCESDSRGAFVVLTDVGRTAIEAAAPLHVEHVRRVFVDALSPTQLDAMGDIAETVLARLDDDPCPDETCRDEPCPEESPSSARS
jgi:DNA-binding MarR family transcriptional regulator